MAGDLIFIRAFAIDFCIKLTNFRKYTKLFQLETADFTEKLTLASIYITIQELNQIRPMNAGSFHV
ncbi:hypothetical protein D3Y55_30780 [Mesorhizobium sp. DCY119]|nr:hypothetical protein D3Y55_30780 [Mesorhizobium sp. DCY119]